MLVEQSVNVALTVADRAYFMERGDDPLQRSDGRTARPSRPAAVGVPVGRRRRAADGGRQRSSRIHRTTSSTSAVLVGVGSRRRVRRDPGGRRRHVRSAAPARSSASSGPTARARPRCSTCISGFTPLQSGDVVLNGRCRSRADSPAERASAGLGRSFQDARLFPELTVEETIAIALERFVAESECGRRRDAPPDVVRVRAAGRAARVDELIELMGLGAYRRRSSVSCRPGRRRIVDLTCLVAHRPAVILLDEPSSRHRPA